VGYQHSPEGDAWREPYLAAARSHLDEVAWEDKKLNLSSRQQVASNCPSAACTGDGKKIRL
jgi:hypothetical protein